MKVSGVQRWAASRVLAARRARWPLRALNLGLAAFGAYLILAGLVTVIVGETVGWRLAGAAELAVGLMAASLAVRRPAPRRRTVASVLALALAVFVLDEFLAGSQPRLDVLPIVIGISLLFILNLARTTDGEPS